MVALTEEANMRTMKGVDSASEMESVKDVSSPCSVRGMKSMSFESQIDEPFVNPEDAKFIGDPIPIPESTQDVDKEIEHQLRALYKRSKEFYPRLTGYPSNLDSFPGLLGDVDDILLNNVGDPFTGKVNNVNSRRFEVGVLHWFAALWQIAPEDMWGYVTHGGTEANLQGLFMAREKLQNGILYTSASAHYSIYKVGHILRIPFQRVKAQENGEMDYEDLKRVLKMNAGSPAIINANMGTTMTGAVDNIDCIADAFRECGYSRDEYHIHCDAALSGIMLPFIDSSILSFNKPIDSISVSGHKFLGIPFPCGIFMTRASVKAHSNSFDYVDYVSSSDTTVSGSRNGHSCLHFWCIIAKKGYEGIKQEVMESLRKAQIMREMLEAFGIECSVYENSNTVVFPCPSPELREKWAIAPFGSKAHIVTLQHVSLEKMEELAADLAEELVPDFTVEC